MPDLEANLRRVSPRFTHPQRSMRSLAIYGAVVTLWIALTVGAWFASGLFAWTTGLSYILYDTFLLFYVARKTYFILQGGAMPGGEGGAGGAIAHGGTVGRGTGGPLGGNRAANAEPTLGVLIAAYNEAPALPTTLDALLPQLLAGDVVLVVDDGSHDDTGQILRDRFAVDWPAPLGIGESSVHPGLRVLRAQHGGKARALNAGLMRLQTDLIITVDADTKLAPDALQGVRRAFADEPDLVAACCVIRPVCAAGALSGFFQWFQTYEYIRAFCSRIAWMRADALLLVSGAFAAFRRAGVVTVGGFDPECLVEDYELIHRLHRYSFDQGLAWRVRVLSAPRALTDAPASLPSFLRQRRRWFSGFLQTQYWNCDMTFDGRYGSLGRWMLPIKAIDTMQPVFGLTAFVLLLVFAVLGKLSVVVPVLCVILAKIALDLFFHVWWVHVYGRWTGQRITHSGFGLALLAALAEPFSFQLLRHIGATWGWFSFILRRQQWGVTASVAATGGHAE
jgi:cellulose synthase/poly-beta-1,6-N-acetylglucosamine synthase-like glycosyltransferase